MDAGKSLHEHGVRIGELEPGPAGSIADVEGVAVGHVTVIRDEPDPPGGRGAARTGVTAVVPGPVERLWAEPVPAGVAVLNGAGELTGSLEIAEWGLLTTPVYLTATMSLGRVYDGAVAAAIAADPRIGVETVVIPVVGECDDSHLNDARVVQVESDDAGRALADAASSAGVAEGAVGAGTGMVCFDWKGGIGSSSRMIHGSHTVGVLVLANFGVRSELRVDGVPVGRLLAEAPAAGPPTPAGSCIAVVATDAPLGSAQLTRIARRAGLGLARTGSVAHHGSGEIFLALSTGARAARGEPTPPTLANRELDPLFQATVEATEEAVLNALWRAETTHGREGRVVERLPHDRVLELLASHGRLRV
jgi:D-aminopeptidase